MLLPENSILSWTYTPVLVGDDIDPPLADGLSIVNGEIVGTPTGGNAMYTIRRLVAFSRNSVFYEEL